VDRTSSRMESRGLRWTSVSRALNRSLGARLARRGLSLGRGYTRDGCQWNKFMLDTLFIQMIVPLKVSVFVHNLVIYNV
jgi:hypothetical protein